MLNYRSFFLDSIKLHKFHYYFSHCEWILTLDGANDG